MTEKFWGCLRQRDLDGEIARVNRRTDLMTAITGVMLLGVALYFILPGLVGGLASNIGSVALHSVAPSSSAPSESVAGGSTLSPKSSPSSSAPQPKVNPELDLTSLSPTFATETPSAVPPARPQPTATSTDLSTLGPTHHLPQPPTPAPTVNPPTHHTPHPSPPQSQTVTFNSPLPSSETVGTQADVSATASSGLSVTVSGTTGVCDVSGTTVTFVGPGQCTVTATQAGDVSWAPASASEGTTVS
jgi:hypothetical protein